MKRKWDHLITSNTIQTQAIKTKEENKIKMKCDSQQNKQDTECVMRRKEKKRVKGHLACVICSQRIPSAD